MIAEAGAAREGRRASGGGRDCDGGTFVSRVSRAKLLRTMVLYSYKAALNTHVTTRGVWTLYPA